MYRQYARQAVFEYADSSQFVVDQNYPNPFNPITTIRASKRWLMIRVTPAIIQ